MGCRYWGMQVGHCLTRERCSCAVMTQAGARTVPYQIAIECAEADAECGRFCRGNSCTLVDLARYARQPMRFVRVMASLTPSDLYAGLALARELHASPHAVQRQCAEMLYCWCTHQLVQSFAPDGASDA